jgi:hypothetical protein
MSFSIRHILSFKYHLHFAVIMLLHLLRHCQVCFSVRSRFDKEKPNVVELHSGLRSFWRSYIVLDPD